jgi:hypothetical protein
MSANSTQNGKIRVDARRSIDGIPGCTISTTGMPRKWGRPIPIHKGAGDLPVVVINGIEFLLDEIVARAFLGEPPKCPISGLTVHHFDGDMFNCEVTNLAWRIDPAWAAHRKELEIRGWMRPDHLPVMVARVPPAGMRPSRQHRMFFC